MSLCRFPAPTRLPDDVITVLIGRVPTAYIDAAAPESTVIYDHATSLASIAEGRSPDFLEEFDSGCIYFLSALDLPVPCAQPPVASFTLPCSFLVT